MNAARARGLLKAFDFQTLFLDELGWDNHNGTVVVGVGVEKTTLRAFAQKRGMVAYLCSSGDTAFPDYARRRKIEHQVARNAHEHLIVFVDASQGRQVWQWVRREPGKPAACREHEYRTPQSGDALLQKLESIAFTLDEEATLSLTDVTRRTSDGFDVEKLTKKFFDQFQREHAAFLKFIRGIAETGDREWYASVMLNRLMFVYFIQRKGFLDGDRDYLRNRLNASRSQKGKDKFYSFYRYFLLRLFHEGLGGKDRSAELERLIGKIPYLNGGLFERHTIEQRYPDIHVPDEAFERIFDYFDQYQWHLDERPLGNDDQINPDVLGYIFEKYINQKQKGEMGAYYTKEDITEYIAKTVLVPHLFASAAQKDPVGFGADASMWALLREEPDRYIHARMRHGLSWDVSGNGGRGAPLQNELPLPEEVAKGVHDDNQRAIWNRQAPSEYALATETWREVISRRDRVTELRARLGDGSVHTIDDLVTLNLDLRQFAQDVVDNCDRSEALAAVWQSLRQVTILDPTCGSGAFLFAALGILEPIYEACLSRMERFVLESTSQTGAFKEILDDVASHPNRRYFILKHVILNNLYGVDIMEEAAGICKLRLLLKLAAQVEPDARKPNLGIEPLPDIDFNIRSGNSLVGYVSYNDIKARSLDFEKTLESVEQKAAELQKTFDTFRNRQTTGDSTAPLEMKLDLKKKFERLEDELNRQLASEYLVDIKSKEAFRKWTTSYRPFHWFVQFYDIMKRGGFDVIIGNPPYLEYSKVEGYTVSNYATQKCVNLYAYTVERALALCAAGGGIGMIVPISIACSDKLEPLRKLLFQSGRALWLSHYSNRPGQLFTGAQNRLTVFLASDKKREPSTFSTRYHRWDARHGERENLFPVLRYERLRESASMFHGLVPKVGTAEASGTLQKIRSTKTVDASLSKYGKHSVFWVRVPGYFCQFLLNEPMCRPERGGAARVRGEVNRISFDDKSTRDLVHAVLNSSLYYLFFCAYTDTRHINPADVKEFPLDVDSFSKTTKAQLVALSAKLGKAYERHTTEVRKSGLLIDSVDSKPCKPIIDEIDAVLASHFKLTGPELDYVVNYDIKYRLGGTLDDED